MDGKINTPQIPVHDFQSRGAKSFAPAGKNIGRMNDLQLGVLLGTPEASSTNVEISTNFAPRPFPPTLKEPALNTSIFKKEFEKGFSLLEVMIAITLFAFFVTAYLTSQGYNVDDSRLSEEHLILQQLAERKINELVLDPPKFSNATANTKETKTFEESDFKNYEYTLEIKKVTIPDFAQLFSQKDATTDEAQDSYEGNYFNEGSTGQRNAALEKIIFEELKKNIEKILWQARVTITNKETKYSYTLSTFLTNYNEKIQLNVGF